jgi:protein-S-isoprenylcysteine O-methyltransferase Ste14
MNEMPQNNAVDANKPRTYRVHRILAHSYFSFFVALVIGLILDFIFPIRILDNVVSMPLSLFLILLATLLILWAQKTSRNMNIKNVTARTFCRGPYCYTRSPTHWGLFILIIGFGILANAFFIILCTIISFALGKLIFLKKEEAVLAEKYGAPYLEYKKEVKL